MPEIATNIEKWGYGELTIEEMQENKEDLSEADLEDII